MSAVSDFHESLASFGDDDIIDNHQLVFKGSDTRSDIDALERQLSVALPPELKSCLATTGAFESACFGDVWQTVLIYSAKELGSIPLGLIDFIDYVWGGRPELKDWLTDEERARLNSGYGVFGYRYEDDNVHDYFYFDASGRFGHLPFDQDSMDGAVAEMRRILQGQSATTDLETLLQLQFETVVRSLQEETD